MSVVQGRLVSSSSLPAAIEAWIWQQESAFRVDDVRSAVPAAGVLADLSYRLAAHPAVARIGDAFHTPRTLARRTAFVVRLLPEERDLGMLVLGHRFLPFVPFVEHAIAAVSIRASRGRVVGTECELVPAEVAHSAFRLQDGAPTPEEYGRRNAEVDVLDLVSCGIIGHPPSEVVVACIDFGASLYTLGPSAPASTKQWREAKDLFGGELARVVQSPPPGPVSAARQMLHVVAACLGKGFERPVGPLAELLTQYPGVTIESTGHRTLFRLEGKGAAVGAAPVPQGDSPLAEKLERCLHVAERGIKGGAHAHGPVHSVAWDPDAMTVSATTYDGGYYSLQPRLSLAKAENGTVGFVCACQQHTAKGVCKHGISLLRDLIFRLRQPADSVAAQIQRDLGRPAWSRALDRFERIAKTAPRRDVARDERLTWRIQVQGPAFHVSPYVQKFGANGAWTRGRLVPPDRVASGNEPWTTSQDLEAVRVGTWRAAGSYARYGDVVNPFDTLLRLVGHPLVFWNEELDRSLRLEVGELRLGFVADESGACRPVASVSGLSMDDLDRWHVCEGGVVVDLHEHGRVVLAPATMGALQLLQTLAPMDLSFPEEARAELMARLPAIEALLPVDLPTELAGEEVSCDPTLRLRLSPEDPTGLTATIRMRPLPGGAIVAPGSPPERLSDASGAKRVCVRRNLDDEVARARHAAEALGLPTETGPWTWRLTTDDEALDLVARLQDGAPPGVVVEWADDAKKMRLTREATPKDLRVSVQDASDWFGVEGELDVDGSKVALSALLEALRAGRRYVAVTGGMWVRISSLFRERLRAMADVLHVERGRLSVGLATAPLLREAARETGLLKACAAWNKFLARFDRAMGIAPDPPEGLTATLRPYQVEGYRWLARLAQWGVGGCLADDMGLGKTVQALALLVDRAAQGPALVVAPTSVAANWVAETRRFAPALRPLLYRETDREAESASFQKGDLVVTSYAMALRDAERLSKVAWGTMVLDEAQFVKNSQTKTAQAIRQIGAGWRVALTGTPIENHLGDLWSLFRAVSPGVFGSWERFRERFAAPIERDKDEARRQALARLVRPFVLRRTKEEVLTELPPRTEVRLDAELSPGERKTYEQARVAAVVSLATPQEGEDQRFAVLAALTRLRQLACHPRLVLPDAPAGSAKLALFLETVDELREEGHRALVFSQFTSLLAIVREALDERKVPYRYLDGSTPAAKRDEEVQAFQGGQGDLFLISLKAGGTGLNLTGADYVIHLDPWWNPAVEDQATNRAHRIGQTRPVTVYRIVAEGTIEEKILALHASKRDLVEGVLDGTDRAGKLSTEELIALIREG